MKKLFLLCCAILTVLPLAAVTARISASPARPVAGEVFMLNITVDTTRQFSLRVPDMPDGLRLGNSISSTSSSIRIVNGKRTETVVYGISAIAEKGGKYTVNFRYNQSDFSQTFDKEGYEYIKEAKRIHKELRRK